MIRYKIRCWHNQTSECEFSQWSIYIYNIHIVQCSTIHVFPLSLDMVCDINKRVAFQLKYELCKDKTYCLYGCFLALNRPVTMNYVHSDKNTLHTRIVKYMKKSGELFTSSQSYRLYWYRTKPFIPWNTAYLFFVFVLS